MEFRAELQIRLGPVLSAAPGLPWPAKLTLAIAAPVLFTALAYVAWTRAGWYDEFYTLYVTQPRFGWWEALRGHWLPDNHPPLYYALTRATSWLGESLEARRGVNLLIAGAAFAGGAAALRGRSAIDRRPLAILYFLFLASLAGPFPLIGELRSYFLSFCSVALLVLSAVLLQLDDQASRGPRIALWASAMVAFNTHIVTTVVAGSLLLPFVALALARRDFARFRAFTAPAAVAGTMFLAVVAIQFRLWIGNTAVFWLPGGSDQALGAFRMVLFSAVSSHVLMLLGGVAGLCLLAKRAGRDPSKSASLEAALLLLAGTVLACAIAMALHAWRPLLIPKYLIGLFPPIGMAMAIGFTALADSLESRARAALMLAALGLFLMATWQNVGAVASFQGWDPAARAVRRQVDACSGTVVHAEPRWNDYLGKLQPPDNARVVPYAYAMVAARHGFAIEPPSSRRMATDCPTLFWGQQAGQPAPTVAEIAAYERGRGFVLPIIRVYRFGGGWIAADRPLTTVPAD